LHLGARVAKLMIWFFASTANQKASSKIALLKMESSSISASIVKVGLLITIFIMFIVRTPVPVNSILISGKVFLT
jgi:hypothetical protein